MAMKRLYQCDDCKERRFVKNHELDRAARPKCNGCGSTRMELVSDEGKAECVRRQRERIAGSGGSLILTSSADNPRRKVV